MDKTNILECELFALDQFITIIKQDLDNIESLLMFTAHFLYVEKPIHPERLFKFLKLIPSIPKEKWILSPELFLVTDFDNYNAEFRVCDDLCYGKRYIVHIYN